MCTLSANIINILYISINQVLAVLHELGLKLTHFRFLKCFRQFCKLNKGEFKDFLRVCRAC